MRLFRIILFLFVLPNLSAQVKTIQIRKPLPYDTQHLVLSFVDRSELMPKNIRGKSYFDARVKLAYENLVIKKAGIKKSSAKVANRVPDSCVFIEGKVLDKAIFRNIQTYCNSDGSLIVLDQEINDIYMLLAIKIVKQLPVFIPAQFNGDSVPVFLTIPIRFLNEISDKPQGVQAVRWLWFCRDFEIFHCDKGCFLRRWWLKLFN